MNKLFLLNTENGIKKISMSYNDLYDHFFNMIQNETWKITRVYSNSIDRDEVEQQFTIELWYAFENYDISTGNCISTYIFHRFKKAKRDLLYPVLQSKRNKWKNSNVSSLNVKLSEDDKYDSSNKKFENDETYQQMENNGAEALLNNEALVDLILSHFKTDSELDLIRILIDKKNFSVVKYAEKYSISRVAANNRVKKMKEKMAEILINEWL